MASVKSLKKYRSLSDSTKFKQLNKDKAKDKDKEKVKDKDNDKDNDKGIPILKVS